jgi:hypothetical protein
MTLASGLIATCDECGARTAYLGAAGWTWSESRVRAYDRCGACSLDTPAHAVEDYEAAHPGRANADPTRA